MKTCTKCNKNKNLKEFCRDSTKKGGRYSSCKECAKCRKPYFDSRKVEKSEYNRLHYLKNKDLYIKRASDFYKNNKSLVSKKNSERCKKDINFRLKTILRKRIAKLIKGNIKGGSAVRDLGCTIEKFKNNLESLWSTGMNWSNYGMGKGKWQIDHILALCLFDLSDRKQFLEACHYTNLQPLWYNDHLDKTRKDLRKNANT